MLKSHSSALQTGILVNFQKQLEPKHGSIDWHPGLGKGDQIDAKTPFAMTLQ